QLKAGVITIEGERVRVAPLASISLSRKVAQELKQWINTGQFTLSEPVAPLPQESSFLPQESWGSEISLD
ncbi:MAG: homocysteine biosynthesis protein, partial [Spirulinaceae cyanobacterium]